MRFSEQWLRTYVDPPLSTQELAEKLTMAGLEVEELEPAAPPFAGVVVGRIESIAPHPSADRLRVCSVDVGANEPLQIVCGAPNAAAGMFVPCALEGTRLPGDLTISRQTVRGVESRGMLCSARELGLSDDATGLLDLGPANAPGTDLRAALALDDTLFTLKLTPNRADCLSLVGIAREVAAVTGASHRLADVHLERCQSCITRRRLDRLSALRCKIDRRHRCDGADAGMDEATARAQRHPRDFRGRRHHQLCDARARTAPARV